MTYKIAFSLVMFAVFIHVGKRGDLRDWLGAMIVLSQTALVWFSLAWWRNNDVPPAIIYSMSAVVFVVFSTRNVGIALGVLSALCSISFLLGYLGFVSSEPGQGVSWNVHNITTILCYIQLIALGGSCSGFLHRDSFRGVWNTF